jgi:hypothetical protein
MAPTTLIGASRILVSVSSPRTTARAAWALISVGHPSPGANLDDQIKHNVTIQLLGSQEIGQHFVRPGCRSYPGTSSSGDHYGLSPVGGGDNPPVDLSLLFASRSARIRAAFSSSSLIRCLLDASFSAIGGISMMSVRLNTITTSLRACLLGPTWWLKRLASLPHRDRVPPRSSDTRSTSSMRLMP